MSLNYESNLLNENKNNVLTNQNINQNLNKYIFDMIKEDSNFINNLSSVLEPTNINRKIISFDTFKGFPSVSKKDRSFAKMLRFGISFKKRTDHRPECREQYRRVS